LTQKGTFEILTDMPTKTGKRSRKPSTTKGISTVPDAIVIKLNPGQKKKARESIRKFGVAKFQIEEIEVKVIPSFRVSDRPITCS
jgi:hypothetical protein